MIGARVQIPAWRDEAINGDALGVVTCETTARIDRCQVKCWTVRLDKSGRSVMLYARDCQVLDLGENEAQSSPADEKVIHNL